MVIHRSNLTKETLYNLIRSNELSILELKKKVELLEANIKRIENKGPTGWAFYKKIKKI